MRRIHFRKFYTRSLEFIANLKGNSSLTGKKSASASTETVVRITAWCCWCRHLLSHRILVISFQDNHKSNTFLNHDRDSGAASNKTIQVCDPCKEMCNISSTSEAEQTSDRDMIRYESSLPANSFMSRAFRNFFLSPISVSLSHYSILVGVDGPV